MCAEPKILIRTDHGPMMSRCTTTIQCSRFGPDPSFGLSYTSVRLQDETLSEEKLKYEHLKSKYQKLLLWYFMLQQVSPR